MGSTSGNRRTTARLTTRVAAATWVTGLALAGPQALATAGADTASGSAGSSSGSAASSGGAGASSNTTASTASTSRATKRYKPAATAGPQTATKTTTKAPASTSTQPAASPTTSPAVAAAPLSLVTTVTTPTPHVSTVAPLFNPGSILAIFISNGTAAHPNAGLLIGNGFSFTGATCATSTKCAGGQGGLLLGSGGNGFNGGGGGRAGMVGDGGSGGAGVVTVQGGSGGNGGSALLFGDGGRGGDAQRFTVGALGGSGGSAGLFIGNGGAAGLAGIGVNGAKGGRGALLFGDGGRGGTGGTGTLTCAAKTCDPAIAPGVGGTGGAGGLFGRAGETGFAALPSNSVQLIGYTAVYDPNFMTNTGIGTHYPDDTDPSQPYAIPGTVVDNVQSKLPAGTTFGRFGYPTGSYLTATGANFAQLGLPPSSSVSPYFQYVVADPSKLPAGYNIQQSQVAPWFSQPGGGIQYRIIGPDGKDASVQSLLDAGYLALK